MYVPYDHTTPESGLGQSVAPFVLGLGTREEAELVHFSWPDGVMQCELKPGRRPEGRSGRKQPQDRELPGALHLERPAVCLHRRLPGRRRAWATWSRPGFTASPTATRQWRSRPSSFSEATVCFGCRSPSRWTRSRISITLRSTWSTGRRAWRRPPTSGSRPRGRGPPAR